MKQKFTLKLLILFMSMGLILILLQTYQNRDTAISYSLKKADTLAEVVQSGLTAHMLNNTMDKRQIFLNSIADVQSIDKMWIVRGDNVVKQYGKSKITQDLVHDAMDLNVIKSGKKEYIINEDFSSAKLRVTIPYRTTTNTKINCIQCHNVKVGETLGAVSIIMDISDFKNESILKLLSIFLIILFSVIVLLILVRNMFSPYLKTLDTLKRKLALAAQGEFNVIKTINTNSKDEIDSLVNSYNILVSSLIETFSEIEMKLKGFVGKNTNSNSSNPLIEATDILSNLSLLYQFKKQLQLDQNRYEIYERLGSIFKNYFHFKHLNIYQFEKDEASIVYSHGNLNFCQENINTDCNACRAYRNSTSIGSIENHKNCPSFENDAYFYYCVEKKINKNCILVFNFVFTTKDEYNVFIENLAIVENYISEAKPEIEMRLLLQALEDASLKDGLTGLYNRRYFDTYVKKVVSQSKRAGTQLAVMMIDIDHFKAVNDEYGHDIGDKVLKETAQIIDTNTRESDIVVRFGGEEFVIILINIDNENTVIEVAEKLRSKIAENEIDVYAGDTIKKTASFGYSMFPNDSSSFTSVMKYADLALYKAKETGRNQVIKYQEKKDDDLVLF